MIISEATDPNLQAVSRTNRLPVFLTESIIHLESMGLILLKSISSQEILFSDKTAIKFYASIVLYDIPTIVISSPLFIIFAFPIGIL